LVLALASTNQSHCLLLLVGNADDAASSAVMATCKPTQSQERASLLRFWAQARKN